MVLLLLGRETDGGHWEHSWASSGSGTCHFQTPQLARWQRCAGWGCDCVLPSASHGTRRSHFTCGGVCVCVCAGRGISDGRLAREGALLQRRECHVSLRGIESSLWGCAAPGTGGALCVWVVVCAVRADKN